MKYFSIILVLLLAVGASAKMLKIDRLEPVKESPAHGVDLGVSQRNILDLDYSGKYGLPTQALDAGNPKIVRILAIKVNFVKETPDDPLTTGNGNFDLRSKSEFESQEGHLIDPSPHNSDYFRAHLRALAEYYRVVSNGRVQLVYDVYPVQDDSAYQLDHTMGYYGEQPPQYGLGELMADAWQKADADPGIKFDNPATGEETYDAYIMFHPGSDQQNNLAFVEDTPSDLYTGFVKLGQPFTVDDGRVTIYDGMVMPETASQDNRVIALNAVFAHEFGHQLGLIDLYDTHTFITMCGDFALMDDNGLGVNIDFGETVPVLVLGVMPIFPSAWSRAYLGFVDVTEVTEGNNIKVAAAELDTTLAQILMVPINNDEYYLVENRRTDLDGLDPTAVQADSLTDVILWPRAAVEGRNENNREYDFLIPGSGMLIWHIDESVARMDYNGDGINNFDENQLQWFYFEGHDQFPWDNHRRFVRLEEADGIIDFGGEYFAGYGSQADMFEINTNSAFGPNTNPNTAGNNNGYTGITIDDISAAFRVMSCDVSRTDAQDGWPNYVGPKAQPPVAYDLDGDGSDELLTAVDNYILAYNADGSSFFKQDEGDEVVVSRKTYYGDGEVFDTLALFGHTSNKETISQPLAVGDVDGDGYAEVVAVSGNNTIACFTSFSLGHQGEAIKTFETSWRTNLISAPMIFNYDHDHVGNEICVVTANGTLLVLDLNGNHLGDGELTPETERLLTDESGSLSLPLLKSVEIQRRGAAAADFNQDGEYETAEVFLDGTLRIDYAEPLSINVGGPVYSGLAVGDIDDDGMPELVFCGDNKIYAYKPNGVPVASFPITVNYYIPTGPIGCTPTLADLDGDKQMEIFVGTANGELSGFTNRGDKLSTFPKDVGGTVDYPVVLSKVANGARVNSLSREGALSSVPVGSLSSIEWQGMYGNAANLGSLSRTLTGSRDFSSEIAYLYNYPNPAAEATTIRFGLQNDNTISLKLYNLAGDLVFETKVDGVGQIDNEYELDCSHFASGVYFCQLETESGTREHCSIAVLR